ncbi:MAG: hypothetical protein OXC91_14535 [Rhodobacteraceae bacterium]|nr:hypothetical protein [Paracoccaceae bacterium]
MKIETDTNGSKYIQWASGPSGNAMTGLRGQPLVSRHYPMRGRRRVLRMGPRAIFAWRLALICKGIWLLGIWPWFKWILIIATAGIVGAAHGGIKAGLSSSKQSRRGGE